jgi:putative membrane protein
VTESSYAASDLKVALVALGVAVVGVAVSGIGPFDRFTWFLEVAPVMVALPIMIATHRRFPLTPLVMGLIAFHALVLALGGHYNYARVPLGFWVSELFGFSRNHYDRFGHLIQGFVPAIIGREILLRNTPLRPGKWLFFLVTCICLAISATYEFIEWGTAIATGGADGSAEAFLGTQGDVWDTQSDMAMATVGAIAAQLLLARLHDAQLRARGYIDRVS